MTEPADLRVVAPGDSAPAFSTREDWLAAGRRLVDGRSEASWAFADWLAAGHGAWGKEAVEAAAEATGTSRGKIINYVTASKTYPLTRRRVRLTFSHHLEVAFLPDAERERLLDAAEAGVLGRLHGNARRGLVRDIQRAATAIAGDVNAAIDRIEAAVARIEDPA